MLNKKDACLVNKKKSTKIFDIQKKLGKTLKKILSYGKILEISWARKKSKKCLSSKIFWKKLLSSKNENKV